MSGRILLLGILLLSAATTFSNSATADSSRLDKIHLKLIDEYPSVNHLSAAAFQTLEASEVVVFDVREKSEYEVSHLVGAVRVDPNIEILDFADQYSDQLGDKTAVFYCSVGRRSSKLLSELEQLVEASGAVAAYNLTGGIFQWHNENRPLKSLTGDKTSIIHPYNFYWGRLIENRSQIRYKTE